jgi:hypothetical protein
LNLGWSIFLAARRQSTERKQEHEAFHDNLSMKGGYCPKDARLRRKPTLNPTKLSEGVRLKPDPQQ